MLADMLDRRRLLVTVAASQVLFAPAVFVAGGLSFVLVIAAMLSVHLPAPVVDPDEPGPRREGSADDSSDPRDPSDQRGRAGDVPPTPRRAARRGARARRNDWP